MTWLRFEAGPFPGIEIEALRFGFDVVARDSLAEGAALEIDQTEAAPVVYPVVSTVA